MADTPQPAPNPDFIPLDGPTSSNSDFIPLEPTGKEKPLQNRPDDTLASGMAKNAATSTIKGLSHIPGAGGDISDFGTYLFQRAMSAITGTPMAELQRRHQEAVQRKADFENRNLGFTLPSVPSGTDISAPILRQTGEYQPTTPEGRLGSAALETGLSMAGPGGLSKGLEAADQGANALRIAREIGKGAVKAVPGGAVAGAVGNEVGESMGDPLIGMLASSALPFAAQGAKAIGRGTVAPFIPSMRQGAADRRLTSAATNPESVIASVQNRAPKPGETLGESTLDPGILQTEKAAGNTSRSFQEHLARRDAARGQDRVDTINNLAPPADTLAPAKLFRQRLAEIEDATQQGLERARQTQQEAHAALPAGKSAEETGTALQGIAAQADKAKGAMVSRLYKAVDPDGNLNVYTVDPAQTAQKLRESINPQVTIPSPIAHPVIDMVANLKQVTPFRDLMDLDQTITAKMSEASRAGDRIGHGQLVTLKGAVGGAIDQAVENQAKWEQGAVARGELKPEDTTGARLLQQDIINWYANRDARSDISSATIGNAGAGSATVPRAFRGQGQVGGRPFPPPGDQGVPGLEPNFDEGAAGRLSAAKQGHAERAQTFREGPVGKALDTNGFAGQFTQPAAKIPAAAFPKGDIGYHNVRAWLRAGADNPDTVGQLQNVAVSRLRDTMKDGVLTPDALQKWKQDYAPALKALDEAQPKAGWLTKFQNAASATAALEDAAAAGRQAVTDAQKGTAAKFLKLQHPDEVGDTIMGMVKAKTGPSQLADLWSQMDDAGRAGGRRALTDTILRDHTNSDNSLSGAKLRNFINDNAASLERVYGRDGMNVLSTLADDAARYQKARGIQTSKTGSDSFANFMRWAKENSGHATSLSLGGALMLEGVESLWNLDPAHFAAVVGMAAAKHLAGALRARGMHKISDLVEMGMTDPEVGAAMMQRALDGKGQFKQEALQNLANAVMRSTAERQTLEQNARLGRASGGRIGRDPAASARKLLTLAEKAKKIHQNQTKPLLQMPDEAVAHALKVANRAVGGET